MKPVTDLAALKRSFTLVRLAGEDPSLADAVRRWTNASASPEIIERLEAHARGAITPGDAFRGAVVEGYEDEKWFKAFLLTVRDYWAKGFLPRSQWIASQRHRHRGNGPHSWKIALLDALIPGWDDEEFLRRQHRQAAPEQFRADWLKELDRRESRSLLESNPSHHAWTVRQVKDHDAGWWEDWQTEALDRAIPWWRECTDGSWADRIRLAATIVFVEPDDHTFPERELAGRIIINLTWIDALVSCGVDPESVAICGAYYEQSELDIVSEVFPGWRERPLPALIDWYDPEDPGCRLKAKSVVKALYTANDGCLPTWIEAAVIDLVFTQQMGLSELPAKLAKKLRPTLAVRLERLARECDIAWSIA